MTLNMGPMKTFSKALFMQVAELGRPQVKLDFQIHRILEAGTVVAFTKIAMKCLSGHAGDTWLKIALEKKKHNRNMEKRSS